MEALLYTTKPFQFARVGTGSLQLALLRNHPTGFKHAWKKHGAFFAKELHRHWIFIKE